MKSEVICVEQAATIECSKAREKFIFVILSEYSRSQMCETNHIKSGRLRKNEDKTAIKYLMRLERTWTLFILINIGTTN